jgi:hypothetical protein
MNVGGLNEYGLNEEAGASLVAIDSLSSLTEMTSMTISAAGEVAIDDFVSSTEMGSMTISTVQAVYQSNRIVVF